MKSHNLIPAETRGSGASMAELISWPIIASIPLVAYLAANALLFKLDPALMVLGYIAVTTAWSALNARRGQTLRKSLLPLGVMLSVYSVFYAVQSSPIALGTVEPMTTLARVLGVVGPSIVVWAMLLRAHYTSAVTWATLALLTACSVAFIFVGAWNTAIGLEQLAAGAYWLSIFTFGAAMACTTICFSRDVKAYRETLQSPFGRQA